MSTSVSFTLVFALLFCHMAGTSYGMMCGALFSNVEVAIALSLVFVWPFVNFSGFFRSADELPPVVGLIKYISMFRYGFYALLNNEYDGFTIDCAEDDYTGKDKCKDPLDDVTGDIWDNIAYVIIIMVVVRLIAVTGLKILANKYSTNR
jgi:hypothetical protein